MNPYILVKRKSHNTQTKHAPYLYLCSLIACFCDAGLKIGTLRRTRVYLETLEIIEQYNAETMHHRLPYLYFKLHVFAIFN